MGKKVMCVGGRRNHSWAPLRVAGLWGGAVGHSQECRACGCIRHKVVGTAAVPGHDWQIDPETAPNPLEGYAVDVVRGDRVVGQGRCVTPVETVRRWRVGRVWFGGKWRTLRVDPDCGLGTPGEGDLAFCLPG